jgi:hypothetical protein
MIHVKLSKLDSHQKCYDSYAGDFEFLEDKAQSSLRCTEDARMVGGGGYKPRAVKLRPIISKSVFFAV